MYYLWKNEEIIIFLLHFLNGCGIVYPLIYDLSKEVKRMKNIHPNYEQTTITCACGNVIATGSTKKDIRVEICSKCHPFFTGKQKLNDAGGRVDRFNKRFGLGK